MNFNEIIQIIHNLIQANPVGSVAAAFIFIFLLFWRPKIFVTLLLIALAAVVVMHLFAKLTATGLEHKKIPFIK